LAAPFLSTAKSFRLLEKMWRCGTLYAIPTKLLDLRGKIDTVRAFKQTVTE
jgi:hypothetical protein